MLGTFFWQTDVKANSDLKHAKDSLAAEKKKKKTLEKNLVDVSVMFNKLRRQNFILNITIMILNTTVIVELKMRYSYNMHERVS